MTTEQQEQVEVLRRIAERGLKQAQWEVDNRNSWSDSRNHVDLWQHMIDEIERLKP